MFYTSRSRLSERRHDEGRLGEILEASPRSVRAVAATAAAQRFQEVQIDVVEFLAGGIHSVAVVDRLVARHRVKMDVPSPEAGRVEHFEHAHIRAVTAHLHACVRLER